MAQKPILRVTYVVAHRGNFITDVLTLVNYYLKGCIKGQFSGMKSTGSYPRKEVRGVHLLIFSGEMIWELMITEGNFHAGQSAKRRMKISSIVGSSFFLSLGNMILITYSKQISKKDLHNKINFHCSLCRLVGMRVSGRSIQGKLLLLLARIDKKAILNFMSSYLSGQGNQSRF